MNMKNLAIALLLALCCATAMADNAVVDGKVQGLNYAPTLLKSNGQYYSAPGDATNGMRVTGSITVAAITWTQTIVTITAATSRTLVAANASRKALRWMVVGTNPMTVAPGLVSVTVGQGMNYNGNAGTGQQGGADTFVGELSTQAFSCNSTSGTTVCVWEGQ